MSVKHDAGVQTRQKLLRAAIEQIRTSGITGLTLDAVAKEAGVSKGGLLHHFPSKDALVNGLIRQFFANFEERVRAYYERDEESKGRWTRAYVQATFDDAPMLLELLLVSTLNDELMKLIRDDFDHWNQRLLNDEISPVRATIIRQSADAYWTERIIQPEIDPALRAALRDELLRMTREA